MKPVIVYGTGGHAKVILEILEAQKRTIAGVLDDDQSLWQTSFCQTTVLGGFDTLKDLSNCEVIIAIGNNAVRRQIALKAGTLNQTYTTAIHPSAQLSPSSRIDTGTVVMANVAFNADSTVGHHAILNTGCTVDHDCVIGDFAHLSPGTHLAGNVQIGSGAHLGVGVSVIPGIRIGDGAIVGAGATVVEDIPANCTAVGVPAKVIKQHSEATA